MMFAQNVIDIPQGGTGARTAPSALANLNAASQWLTGTDCSESAGADAGAQINACITSSGADGIYNAGGITGAQAINGTSPIPTGTPTGEWLAGDTTYWLTSSASSIVIPTRFHVKGIGTTIQAGNYNTIFRACNGETTGTPCAGGSFPSNTPIFCFGNSGACNLPTSQQQYDSYIMGVTIDCNGVSGCIGVQNKTAQEKSGVFDSDIVNWGNGGIGLDIEDGSPSSPSHSMYARLVVGNDKQFNCTLNAVGVKIDDNLMFGLPWSLDKITVHNPGCCYNSHCTGNVMPTDNIRISGLGPMAIRDYHGEIANDGIHVGADATTSGITLDSISGLSNAQIYIDNAFTTENIIIHDVRGCCQLINDQVNGNTIGQSSENGGLTNGGGVALYAMGPTGSGTGSGTKVITTAVSVVQSRTASFTDIAPAVSDSGLILVINPATPIHLLRAYCAVQGTTNVVINLDKRTEAAIATDTGNHLLASNLTAVAGGAHTFAFANGASQCGATTSCAIAAHSPVVATISSISGAPTDLQCSVDYTID